jgi:hypothetical protein
VSIFDRPRPTGPPRHLGPDVGSGVDLLPRDDPAFRRRSTVAKQKALKRFRCPDCNVVRQVIFLNPTEHDLYAGKPLTCPECSSTKTPIPGRGRLPLGAALLRDLRQIHEASCNPLVMAQRLADGSDDLAELRARGWTNETLQRAVADGRQALARRVASVTAGAGAATNATAASTRPELLRGGRPPAPAVTSLTPRHRIEALLNVGRARALGHDPDKLYPAHRASRDGLVTTGARRGPARRGGREAPRTLRHRGEPHTYVAAIGTRCVLRVV